MREKLIELLMDMPFGHSTYEENERHMEDLADYLIANGVTVQQWIPVTERLPKICETVLICFDFMDGKAYRVSDRYGKNGMLWAGLPDNSKVTHWMPLPQPPKEG